MTLDTEDKMVPSRDDPDPQSYDSPTTKNMIANFSFGSAGIL
jgi:hypothetical protein